MFKKNKAKLIVHLNQSRQDCTIELDPIIGTLISALVDQII